MSVNLPDKLKPSMGIAIDMLVTDPEAKIKDVAEKSGVTSATIHNWLKDPEFVEVFYQKYMVTFGAKLPNILNSMIREAEAGNVQAGRLVLEHSGKLIKRVEVANHKSPFEKFLTTQDSKEVEVFDADYEVMPQRPVVPDTPPTKTELTQKQKAVDKKNKKRREARRWRERAEKAGLSRPKQGRQTPAQRKAWQEQIIKREKALNLSSSDK
jgi:predicted DNA-binding transcriptional regulator AlpA